MRDLIYKEECYAIIGGCMAVYRDKGCGFLEPIYQECLEIEFEYLGLPALIQPKFNLAYRGRELRHAYQPDFVCFERIIVEIKAVSTLADEHRAQLLNYLNASGFALGLLVNFGHHPGLEFERIVNTRTPSSPSRLSRDSRATI
jgi:GxxExxY protein